jgi:hypothetical protein
MSRYRQGIVMQYSSQTSVAGYSRLLCGGKLLPNIYNVSLLKLKYSTSTLPTARLHCYYQEISTLVFTCHKLSSRRSHEYGSGFKLQHWQCVICTTYRQCLVVDWTGIGRSMGYCKQPSEGSISIRCALLWVLIQVDIHGQPEDIPAQVP